jgi:prophage regulatory protein
MARPEITSQRTGRRLLSYADLKARGCPYSRMHLRRLEAAGKFPLHIDLGENTIAWFEDEYDDHLEAKAAARPRRNAEAKTEIAETA